jgi:hypothetical protein
MCKSTFVCLNFCLFCHPIISYLNTFRGLASYICDQPIDLMGTRWGHAFFYVPMGECTIIDNVIQDGFTSIVQET